jgi:hypothetical protein
LSCTAVCACKKAKHSSVVLRSRKQLALLVYLSIEQQRQGR